MFAAHNTATVGKFDLIDGRYKFVGLGDCPVYADLPCGMFAFVVRIKLGPVYVVMVKDVKLVKKYY